MKTISIFLVFVSFYAFAKAQNTPPKSDTVAHVTYELGVGDYQKINDIKVTFLKVLEDSRCPKGVECVWAGQAIIKVRIKEKGRNPIEKKVILGANPQDRIIHISEEFTIKAMRLSPYPDASTAKSSYVYLLELQA